MDQANMTEDKSTYYIYASRNIKQRKGKSDITQLRNFD